MVFLGLPNKSAVPSSTGVAKRLMQQRDEKGFILEKRSTRREVGTCKYREIDAARFRLHRISPISGKPFAASLVR
ncbi:MAG: hypothetical protein HKL80_04145 [Acidimicrobiales bacterium]|nr:hypothetical protein [Acidimicrobiales bacterium]